MYFICSEQEAAEYVDGFHHVEVVSHRWDNWSTYRVSDDLTPTTREEWEEEVKWEHIRVDGILEMGWNL